MNNSINQKINRSKYISPSTIGTYYVNDVPQQQNQLIKTHLYTSMCQASSAENANEKCGTKL